MQILTPNGLKKLRSEKITYCLVDPIIRKLVTYAMRSSGSDTFLGKTGVKNVFANTGKNTVIAPNFRVWKVFRKVQFPHQEITSNCGIFRSVVYSQHQVLVLLHPISTG